MVRRLAASAVFVFLAVTFEDTSSSVRSGDPSWNKLPYNPDPVSRLNDGFFLTPSLGWIANGAGQIHKTTDGGETWERILEKTGTHFRSVGFINPQRGWAGTIGLGNTIVSTDPNILYETTDGGLNWTPVTAVNSLSERGLCGMHVLNDTVVNAVGRVRGPSHFYRTTDAGENWTVKDMSAYAAGLIDVYFFNPDTGLAVGLTNSVHENSSGVVLLTTDGGVTWEKKFQTTRFGEWCWKISFPTRETGFVSIQRNSQSNNHFLRTTDGGLTWSEHSFPINNYFVQGIGFATEAIGWIGGRGAGPLYETRDGGSSWVPIGLGRRVNRFRLLSPTLGYAMGDSVYKYELTTPVSVALGDATMPAGFGLGQNYPNPFNSTTIIEFSVPSPSYVTVKVFNATGREMETLVETHLSGGKHSTVWNAEGMASGVYYVRLSAGGYSQSRKIVLQK